MWDEADDEMVDREMWRRRGEAEGFFPPAGHCQEMDEAVDRGEFGRCER